MDVDEHNPLDNLRDNNVHEMVVAKLLKRYVYIAAIDRFYDTKSGFELTSKALSSMHLHSVEKTKPDILVLGHHKCIKVDNLVYLPGHNENPVIFGKKLLWNTWRDPEPELPKSATEEQISEYLEHLEYLVPKPDEQTHILDWMAYLLKNPGDKINHAILLAGTTRVGKDLLFNPLRYGLGVENVCEPHADELTEHYTDYLDGKKLIIFQEVMDLQGLRMENKLKPMLAAPPDVLRVRKFGRGFYETPNLIQAIFMSNYRRSLHISEGDGRYFAVWTSAKRLGDSYYIGFTDWQKNGGNALVVRWLLSRDVSKFQPKALPPDTDFKNYMIEGSKSGLRQLLEELRDSHEFPLNNDIAYPIDIYKHSNEFKSTRTVGNILIEMGAVSRKCRPMINGKRLVKTLYAIRNIDHWCTKDDNGNWLVGENKWLAEYDKNKQQTIF